MPEGDTVYRTAAKLREALAGRELTRCDIRVPRYAAVDLSGQVVDEVLSRGKHLFIRVGQASIHSHLKMDGAWVIGRVRVPAYKIRIVLETATSRASGVDLGVLEVLDRATDMDAVAHLGPDLLGEDWSAEVAAVNLMADPDRPLGEALLDQRNLAGIGTIYRTELCFLTGYDPRDPVRVVRDPLRMVRLARTMLEQNRHHAQIVTTGDKRRGRSLWIYGRGQERCLRCGSRIERAELGQPGVERVAYWCPTCQPAR